MTKITRRRFIRLAGGTIAAAALSCSGLALVGTQRPEVDLITSACGGTETMNKRVLVAYATKCGSTGEVAEAIGKVLCDKGYGVDVLPIKDVEDLSIYQAAVIGSAIRIGQWLPEARTFLEANAETWKAIQTAIFATSLQIRDADEAKRKEAEGYLVPLHASVTPVAEAIFAGTIDPKRMNLLERLATKATKAPIGDFRDWDAIQAWAADTATAL
jgi:menaquinone-dependent protoporphyrinogen oxidase